MEMDHSESQSTDEQDIFEWPIDLLPRDRPRPLTANQRKKIGDAIVEAAQERDPPRQPSAQFQQRYLDRRLSAQKRRRNVR